MKASISFCIVVIFGTFLTNSLIGQTIHSSQGYNCVEYTLKSDNTLVGKQYTNGAIAKYINGTWSQSSYQRGYETTVTISSSGYSTRLSAYYNASGSLEQFIDLQGRRWSMGSCDGSSSNSEGQQDDLYLNFLKNLELKTYKKTLADGSTFFINLSKTSSNSGVAELWQLGYPCIYTFNFTISSDRIFVVKPNQNTCGGSTQVIDQFEMGSTSGMSFLKVKIGKNILYFYGILRRDP